MVDVNRYGDAVGASAIAARTRWSGGAANFGCTLGGASGEGGLLATFDAIFQQTVTPPPSAPATRDPAPSSSEPPPVADDAEPARAAEEEEDEKEDDKAPGDVRLATPLAEPPVVEAPAAVAEEEPAVSEEEPEAESVVAAAAAAAPKVETPAEQSAAAATDQPAEEQGVLPTTDGKTRTPSKQGEHPAPAIPRASEADQPTQPVEQAADPTAPVDKPAAATTQTPVAEEGETADETPQVAKELHRSTVAMQESQPATDEPAAVDEVAAEEQTAELAADGEGENDRGRDRGRGARYNNRDEPGERPVGGAGARASEASTGSRTLDSLVAQMQAVDAGDAGAAPQAGATPGAAAANPAAAAAASAATLAANASLAANAPAANPTAADASAPSEARFSIDGSGDRRSVGGIKSDAASGEGQVQRGSNADQVRLVQRVARSFQRLGPTGGRVQVMLHPAELGSVRLDLRIEGNRMNARMTAETDAARSILSEHLPELRQRLADSGLVVDRIEVEIDSGSQQEETDQRKEGMGERRDGFPGAPQRTRLPRGGASPSEPAGGSGAISRAAGPVHSRTALDLTV